MMTGALAMANTATATGFCGSNVTPGNVSSFNCGNIASIIGAGSTFTSGYLVYNSTYQFAQTGSPTLVTNFSFSGATYALATDTLTTTDAITGQGSSPAVSSASNPFVLATGAPIAAGFEDAFTAPVGNLIVNYTDTLSGGTVLNNQVNDFAEYVINYSYTVSSTPEPATMALIGGGLVLIGTLRRRHSKSTKA